MLKIERVKLETAVPALLKSLGGVPDIDAREWLFSGGKHGDIRVVFYNSKDAKETPWLTCQLKDWGAGDLPRDPGLLAVNSWHGFNHWKQNLYAEKRDTSATFLQRIRAHLARSGIEPKQDSNPV